MTYEAYLEHLELVKNHMPPEKWQRFKAFCYELFVDSKHAADNQTYDWFDKCLKDMDNLFNEDDSTDQSGKTNP